MLNNSKQKKVRASSVRKNMSGTKARPRLSVHRTSAHIYGQFVDDSKGETLASFSSKNLPAKDLKGKTKTEVAELVGENLAKLASTKKIKSIIFDRGASRYQGRVRALAEAARKGGIKF